MNLLKSYSLQSGAKIGKIELQEKFFPLSVDKYIVLHCFSKPIKNYSYYNVVINLILPYLQKENIQIIQIGGKDDPKLENCLCLNGLTTLPQSFYVIKKALAVLSCDSYSAHVAGHYDIPLLDIIVNNYKENVEPFFGDKTKQIIMEPKRKEGEKPKFVFDEFPKSIDTIKPEEIAANLLKLLNIEFKPCRSTLYFGPAYNNRSVETLPNQVVDPHQFNADKMIVRMDYHFNESVLVEQLKISDIILVTDKPVNTQIIETFKSRIKQIIYVIDENNEVKFAKYLSQTGIPFSMISFLSEEKLNTYKLDYCEIGIIFKKETNDWKGHVKDAKNVRFSTNRMILSGGKMYASLAHLKQNVVFKEINEIIDDADFNRDLDFCYLFDVIP